MIVSLIYTGLNLNTMYIISTVKKIVLLHHNREICLKI